MPSGVPSVAQDLARRSASAVCSEFGPNAAASKYTPAASAGSCGVSPGRWSSRLHLWVASWFSSCYTRTAVTTPEYRTRKGDTHDPGFHVAHDSEKHSLLRKSEISIHVHIFSDAGLDDFSGTALPVDTWTW